MPHAAVEHARGIVFELIGRYRSSVDVRWQ
jgi:hypothetical protein